MPGVLPDLLRCLWDLSAHRTENSNDGPRVGATPSKIPPSLPVSSILMGFSGTSHLNSFQGSQVAIHPSWVGTGITFSDRGLGIKSSVFTSQDLAGKVTNCPGNHVSDSGLGLGGSQNPRTLLGAGEAVTYRAAFQTPDSKVACK